MWRYSLRWRCPHIPCTGEPVPDNILSRFTAGGDYAVCLDFLAERPVKRWPPKRNAQSRCGIFFAYLTPFIAACSGRCRAAGTVPARAGTLMMSRCSSCVIPGHSGCIPSACLSRLDLSKS
jgi:hypothetical protein